MPIPSTKWNALVDQVARGRILGVRKIESKAFRHPWHHRFSWSRDRENWTAQIHPGHVGTTEPINLAELPLSLSLQESNIPDFFAARGVGSTSSRDKRLLYSADTILRIPKTSASIIVEVDAEGVPELTVAYQTPAADLAPSLLSVGQYIAEPEPVPGEIQINFQSAPYHEEHLATAYLLSPAGSAPTDQPDAGWTPYVAHHIFWNLTFYEDIPPLQVRDQPLRSPGLGLGLGVSDNLQQSIIDDINATAALSEILLAKVNVLSRVWSV